MCRQQADGLAARGIAAAHASRGVLDDDAILGLDAGLARAFEVGVGAVEEVITREKNNNAEES